MKRIPVNIRNILLGSPLGLWYTGEEGMFVFHHSGAAFASSIYDYVVCMGLIELNVVPKLIYLQIQYKLEIECCRWVMKMSLWAIQSCSHTFLVITDHSLCTERANGKTNNTVALLRKLPLKFGSHISISISKENINCIRMMPTKIIFECLCGCSKIYSKHDLCIYFAKERLVSFHSHTYHAQLKPIH